MSKLEVDKIDPQSGTDLELGSSGDTITIPTGVTLDASNATTTLPANVVTTDGTQTLTNKSIAATQLTGTITPSDGTVTTAKIVDDNVTTAKVADGAVTNDKVNASAAIDYSKLNLTGNIALADLSATGTKDATTFLRGDNTFAEAGGGASDGFQAITTGSGTSASSGTLVVNDELFDDGSNYSTSNGRYTAPSTGFYHFTAGALQDGSAGGYFYFTKNGSAVGSQTRWSYNGAGNQTHMTMSMTIDLSAGDYVNIYSSQSVYINQYLTFGGFKIY